MASLPPFDWQHAPHYAAMVIACAALYALDRWYDRRQCRRKAALVRPKLAAQHCRRCGGPLDDWDGQFLPGDVHFYPGGYVPRVRVTCRSCRAEQIFYVLWQGRQTGQGSFEEDWFLYNRDGLFEGQTSDRRDA